MQIECTNSKKPRTHTLPSIVQMTFNDKFPETKALGKSGFSEQLL